MRAIIVVEIAMDLQEKIQRQADSDEHKHDQAETTPHHARPQLATHEHLAHTRRHCQSDHQHVASFCSAGEWVPLKQARHQASSWSSILTAPLAQW